MENSTCLNAVNVAITLLDDAHHALLTARTLASSEGRPALAEELEELTGSLRQRADVMHALRERELRRPT